MKRSWHQQFKKSSPEARTTPDGITHASKSEAKRWAELKQMQAMGLICDLDRQRPFPLVLDNGRAVKSKTGRTLRYTPDFVYKELVRGQWVWIYEEHKGYMSETHALRIAIFEAIYGVTVTIHKSR